MFEELDDFDFYTITVTRDHLNKLMAYFSEIGEVTLGVEPTGEVTFNIPEDSDIDVMEINIIKELVLILTRLQHKQESLDKKSKEYKDLELHRVSITTTLEYITQIYNLKIKEQKEKRGKDENDEHA